MLKSLADEVAKGVQVPDNTGGLSPLGALPSFANVLSRRPHPDEIVTALIEGPLAPFTAFAGILLWCKEPSLRMLGLHGYTEEEADGFEEIPLAADLPITRAARDGEIVIGTGARFEADYADERIADPKRWERMRERVEIGAIVSVPVIARGVSIGAFGFTCRDEREWRPSDLALLDTVGRMLALWMGHPDSGIPWQRDVEGDLVLTDRQCQILRLVLQGKTNAAIGAYLGYSESTVKQELSRTMRMMGTRSRMGAAEMARDQGLCEGRPA